MSSERNMEVYAAKLDDPNLDIRSKITFATELRDSIELWCQGSTYNSFLQRLVPVFLKLLDGPPVFMSNAPEQRLRNCIFEILHRLPMTPADALEPYAPRIVDQLMELVKIENDDNAVLCMKTIMDFCRHQPKALQERVQSFLDLIQELFLTMDQAVRDTFDSPASAVAQAIPSTPNNSQYSQSPRPGSPVASVTSSDLGSEQSQARPLLKGMQSFKVLAECPIIVVSLFQSYRNCVHKNVKLFVPLIKNVLLLQAKPQERAHAEAKAQGKVFTGVSKEIRNRAAFGDFITMQVKTMSFLAYLLRVYSQQLTDFLPTLPDVVVRLLKDIPREKSGARKELLVAIRHIINFNFRKIFLKKIDELLDERTLIGDGLTVYEAMRPLAYSMLADLIHHLRESLSREQIRKTVEVYTKNLHDSFPGTSFQTMSAKLLLNMAECIAKLEPKQDARYFLIMILNAIGDKFAAMNRQYKNAVKLSEQYTPLSIEAAPENFLADKDRPPDWDEIDIFSATPIKTTNPRERSSDPIADNKFLFKNLLHGLKNLFYNLRACNPPQIKQEIETASAPANWHEVSFGYNAEEVEVLIKLFREGARVFRYYATDKPGNDSQALNASELIANPHMMSSNKEEKELLESFATVFHHIDPATFHEVFQSEIPHLYDMMFDHAALLHVPQFLLASEATSPSFAGMLLQFLMGKLEEVGTSDTKKSSILLRLFKLSFMAVTLFSSTNEQVLLPHVTKIVTQSIKLSTTAEEPMNYFLLLRSLFRSIGGGRFEHLYKEILPLLEMMLEVLNNLLLAARKPTDRDLFVELILTVPARLSNLLPHLSYLMRPLVVALRAGSELVGQGLRTLELCVDNLTADYLDPIMAPVIDELMAALWEHLKPNPYSHFHAHTTMRILGKLGGRNRKFLTGPPQLEYKNFADDEPSFDLRLIGSTKDKPFPSTIGIEHAILKIMEVPKNPKEKKSDAFHKQQAFKLVAAQLKLQIGADTLPEDFAQLVRLQANDLCARKFDVGQDLMSISERDKSSAKKDFQQETMKKLLKACFIAVSVPELREEANSMITNLCRHFTLLEIGRALAQAKHDRKHFDVKSGEGPVVIDSRVIADAISESLASDIPEVRDVAERAIVEIRDAAVVIFGSAEKIDTLPFFLHIARTFIHNCHQEEWFTKSGGTLGIEIVCTKLGLSDAWINELHLQFVRALMYVMKDMPQDLSARTRNQAQATLETLLQRCKFMSKDDLSKPQSKLYQLCGSLIYELAHMNRHVREMAQKAFALTAEVVGVEVHELMMPVKDRLLNPIYNKPLRALPVSVQIGYVDAITFCLKIPHNMLELNEQLQRLLMECLALADAEDELLANKPTEQRNAEAIVQLRVACLRLLSLAQNLPEFNASPPNQSRQRIIAIFFKSLYSKSPDVIEAAYSGLQSVLTATSKLPKDILQGGLRPILMNLQDPRKLSVEGLEGLARLLKLLTNYFKVEIGSRLLDHIKTIADPTALQKISFTLIEQNRQMKIIAAIFNVFHLLPPAAISFLEPLVKKIMKLETSLRRTHFSPFREPLLKYLNHYPKESWTFFAPLLKNHADGRFFAQILADPSSRPLRDVVIQDVPGLLKAFQVNDEKEKWPAAINGIHVAFAISNFPEHNSWLVNNDNLRKGLFEAGKGLEIRFRQNTIDPSLRLAAEQAGEHVMRVFTVYLAQEPNNLDSFFDVVEAVTAEELRMSSAFIQFIYSEMISNHSVEYWRTLVLRSIEVYTGRNTSQKAKTFAFHYIVNPIFAMDVKRNWDSLFGLTKGTKLMDKSMTEAIHNRLWRPQSSSESTEESGQLGVDHSRMELLQLTTMLIKYHHNLISETRKDVIKFGWNYIRLEDVINKHAAYVLIAYFIAQYETPHKIAVQVYSALLRAHQNEGRSLVTQALELLAPVLKKRIGGGDAKVNMWARIPRKILSEESSNLQQLMCIFNFFVRHTDLFYEAREQLAQIIIPALQKIAAPPNPSNESKRIALNLINLIWQWEERAAKESVSSPDRSNKSPSKRKVDGAPVPSSSNLGSRNFVAPAPIRMMLIKYMITFIISLPERYPTTSSKLKEQHSTHHMPPQSTEVCRKSVQLLRNLLSPPYWTDLDVDPILQKQIELVLTSELKGDDKPEAWTTRIINTLQVLKVILNVKSDDWVLNRMSHLQKLCEKPLRMDNPEVQDCLHDNDSEIGDEARPTLQYQPLVKRILDVMPEVNIEDEDPTETPSTEFVNFCGIVATETLSNGSHVPAVNLLWTLCQRRPDEIDQHLQHLMKALHSKLAKEHLSANIPAQGQAAMAPNLRPDTQSSAPPDPFEFQIQISLILKVIDTMSARMNSLGDQRRPFLSVLASLVERSQSNEVCLKILSLVENWIFHSTEVLPTLKERVAVLHKMLLFEQRQDSTLLTKFLDLVIRIYEDPKIMRSELTVRLEHAFLIGTRAQDVEMRNRFMTIFDRSISRSASSRLKYVIASQNWDTLQDSYWLNQVIQLLFGSIEMNPALKLHEEDFKTIPASTLFNTYSKDSRLSDLVIDDQLDSFVASHRRFCLSLGDVKIRDILEPLGQLQHTSKELAHKIWVPLFGMFWHALPKEDRPSFQKDIVGLLTKDYHTRQIDQRPNCVQTLLEGCVSAKPRLAFPPHIMKYLARTYSAWYTATTYLENSANDPIVDTPLVRESNLDSLLEIYAGLEEQDLFYGTWRRRCEYIETNAALSYEQNGMWDKAQEMYEMAQIKARTGTLPFSQGEYMLWEDHWVQCAQKLQQWEILSDFAKHENFNDLTLESTYRAIESWSNAEQREQYDSIIKSVSDAPTPRRVFFQAFMSLLKLHNKQETPQEFNRICDEAIQLSIRKWHQLPKRITNAHIPILQNFQQLVELHDASVICSSLGQTTSGNLDIKSQELKLLLTTWRDRLPNFWDDINAWQGLVTWRQHIFQLINGVYLHLIPQNQGGATSNSFAYRGYHETAWIINRFAHVARKHNLPDVCIAQLSRIYTLPNIEIQEAFLKLREQAKCHYRNRSELQSGLDVINNTNLNYFGAQQKAEFYTLKGMFLNKLGQTEEANDAFGSALYFDIKLPKAWAEWGYYNDMLFKENPSQIDKANSAISCYLEAASQYKNGKSRKLLGRILWLLSLDDSNRTLASAFEAFKGDTPIWYWITWIPQLLGSLSRQEAPIARVILGKLAKTYPQALFFQLRTTREDMHVIRKQQEAKEAKEKRQKQVQGTPDVKQSSPERSSTASGAGTRPGTANGENQANGVQTTPKQEGNGASTPNGATGAASPETPKKPWDYTEEIMASLKTAFPLLALSMETMVDQIHKHFKCPPDEDAYRLIVALLNDGMTFVGRSPTNYGPDVHLPSSTEANITRFAESVLPAHIRKAFEADFVTKKPTMYEYIQKLRKWRARFEEKLDRRTLIHPFEAYSPHLSEFRFQKFDEVEVPGQYLLHRDKNQDFVRIERFASKVDLVRGIGYSYRRIRILGHDGSVHPFAIQNPATRHSRREERIMQLFRIFNGVLSKRKESRRRNLQFNLPLMVPLSPAVRIVQDDASYISLQGVYEDSCRRHSINKDDPVLFTVEKLRQLMPRNMEQANAIRLETFIAIQERYVSHSLALDYFRDIYPTFADFWLFRKTFSYQFAALTFMTYIMHMHTRYPHKLSISRATGNVWGSELVASLAGTKPTFHNPEAVPFRLTPNLQTLMGPLATEGIYAPTIMAIARCLTEPEGELEMQLSIFIRDEMMLWYTQQHRQQAADGQLRENVQMNSDLVVKRAVSLAQPPNGNLPANQTVVDLIACAVNPTKLCQLDALWMPYL
ncbi:hypothetical protein M501DRAFT_1000466 [Patellaria atrata CBS 101060]|uniref:Non-specific serine/threonine protein kinase n=1 Tax=Patellaria atrata CBS 101060 TaxID=1346257 RepID=A0A9P4SGD7_9PEZI|nr:hypothetical protein M501DRAFT_1000466 [Patellaria atrata CBS 101060]